MAYVLKRLKKKKKKKKKKKFTLAKSSPRSKNFIECIILNWHVFKMYIKIICNFNSHAHFKINNMLFLHVFLINTCENYVHF
jgi:hypothetical protein